MIDTQKLCNIVIYISRVKGGKRQWFLVQQTGDQAHSWVCAVFAYETDCLAHRCSSELPGTTGG